MNKFKPLYERFQKILQDQDIIDRQIWVIEVDKKPTLRLENKRKVLERKFWEVVYKMHLLPKEEYLLACQAGCLDGLSFNELKEWLGK
jgi:hypothetical protein